MTARTAQVPSLRVLPREKKLIDRAAKAAGQSVTDWARDQILRLAREARAARIAAKASAPAPEAEPSAPEPVKAPPVVLKDKPKKRRGLELDEETRGLLLAGYPYRG